MIAGVIAGAPLPELAALARVPLWTRKLGPECFAQPFGVLPDGALFSRQIGNYLPQARMDAALWLSMVNNAHYWGDEALALWFARALARGEFSTTPKTRRTGRPGRRRRAYKVNIASWPLLCLWAWHAQQPRALASRFIDKMWSPDMSVETAIGAARDWRDSLEVQLELGEADIADAWATPSAVDGYEFAPLINARDIVAHAELLSNCARGCAFDVAGDRARLWIVRRDGALTAMLELGFLDSDPLPSIRGLACDARLARAPEFCVRHAKDGDFPFPQHRWRTLWRGYWLAKRAILTWLPLTGSRGALFMLY